MLILQRNQRIGDHHDQRRYRLSLGLRPYPGPRRGRRQGRQSGRRRQGEPRSRRRSGGPRSRARRRRRHHLRQPDLHGRRLGRVREVQGLDVQALDGAARGRTSSPPASPPRRRGAATSRTRSTSCSRSPCSTAWCGSASACRRATTTPRARPRISTAPAPRSALMAQANADQGIEGIGASEFRTARAARQARRRSGACAGRQRRSRRRRKRGTALLAGGRVSSSC